MTTITNATDTAPPAAPPLDTDAAQQPDFIVQGALRRLIVVLLALAMAAVLRGLLVVPASFPLGDGGLLYARSGAIMDAGFLLPAGVEYNAQTLTSYPPPLAHFIAGWTAIWRDSPLLAVFRAYPAIISLLTIPLFYAFSRRVLRSVESALVATLIFALYPTSLYASITGSGITVATGMVFALVTINLLQRLLTTQSEAYIFFTAIFAALTVMTAVGWTVFLVYTSVILLVIYGSRGRGGYALLHTIMVVLLTLTFTSVWLVSIVRFYGVLPLFNLLQTVNEANLRLIYADVARELVGLPFMLALLVLGLLGWVMQMARRRFFVPALTLAVLLFGWTSMSVMLAIPVALLVGIGVGDGCTPWLTKRLQRLRPRGLLPMSRRTRRTSHYYRFNLKAHVLVAYMLFTLLIIAGLVNPFIITRPGTNQPLRQPIIDRDEQVGFRWVLENTLPGSEFVVLTGINDWRYDPVNDWFPALTERHSVTTVHGAWWQGDAVFQEKVALHLAFQACINEDAACLNALIDDLTLPEGAPLYLYFAPIASRSPLLAALRDDIAYEITELDGDITILRDRRLDTVGNNLIR